MPSVTREQYLYLKRNAPVDTAGGKIHAVDLPDMPDDPVRRAAHTLCGVFWESDWARVSLRETQDGFEEGVLCGICDKAIRVRIREWQEADALRSIRQRALAEAGQVLEALSLSLSEAMGGLWAARDALARVEGQVREARSAVLMIQHGRPREDDRQSE